MKIKKPKVMLIGAGKFGKHHLRILQKLAAQDAIDFKGVCVKTQAGIFDIQKEHPGLFLTNDYLSALPELDAVCIATPTESHYEIIHDCLPHVHVLAEKPLTLSVTSTKELEKLAKEYNKHLMVGYIFRFNSLTETLKKIIDRDFSNLAPEEIEAHFINHSSAFKDQSAAFEFIHWPDLVTYLLPSLNINLESLYSQKNENITEASMTYSDGIQDTQCLLALGWGHRKKRNFVLQYEGGVSVAADYLAGTITKKTREDTQQYHPPTTDALEKELSAFFQTIKESRKNPTPPSSIIESVRIAEKISSFYE